MPEKDAYVITQESKSAHTAHLLCQSKVNAALVTIITYTNPYIVMLSDKNTKHRVKALTFESRSGFLMPSNLSS